MTARPVDTDQLALDAARCLGTPQGERLLGHLRRITVERRLAPDCPEAELRHREGQRHLRAHIEALMQRGGEGTQLARIAGD